MVMPTSGIVANAISVSDQFMYSRYASMKMIVSELRMLTVIASDAAEATCCASKVTFESRNPAELAS